MMMMYKILGLPHIIAYLWYRHKIPEINKDLGRYTNSNIGGGKAISECLIFT